MLEPVSSLQFIYKYIFRYHLRELSPCGTFQISVKLPNALLWAASFLTYSIHYSFYIFTTMIDVQTCFIKDSLPVAASKWAIWKHKTSYWLLYGVNSILDNKYIRANIFLSLQQWSAAEIRFFHLSYSRNRVCCPHTLTWTGCGTMKIHRAKTQLSSFKELLMKKKNMAMVKHKNMAFLQRAWMLNNVFVSLF